MLHGRLVLRLGRLLDEFVEAGGHGVVVVESGTLLERDPDTVRGPDVAFYSHERIPEDAYATTFWGPPDLAVEITSPGNRVSEAQERVKSYLDAGIRLAWVIDPPTRTATTYRTGGEARLLGPEDSLDGGDVLPGFSLSVSVAFRSVAAADVGGGADAAPHAQRDPPAARVSASCASSSRTAASSCVSFPA